MGKIKHVFLKDVFLKDVFLKNASIKRSMAATFMLTICVISLLSGMTVFLANQAQQEILRSRYFTVKSPHFRADKHTGRYQIDIDASAIEWHGLSAGENIAFYGCYFAMTVLPFFYIAAGIGSVAAIYYRVKLRVPILQLQNGMRRIQEHDLDFVIEYSGEDELGKLCSSMEKMRKELRRKNKALWETLQQRKLLNASVAHDLRTPITVLKGYLDFLEKNIPQDKITEEMLMETIGSMQGALSRLERYTECVRYVEKIESIEIQRERQDTALLLKEMESSIRQLEDEKNIIFWTDVSLPSVNIDKSVVFRVLENLLQNAMRYKKEQIIVKVYQKDNLLVLSVKDDGKGFSKDDLKQAGNMFYGKEKGNFYGREQEEKENIKGNFYGREQERYGNPKGNFYGKEQEGYENPKRNFYGKEQAGYGNLTENFYAREQEGYEKYESPKENFYGREQEEYENSKGKFYGKEQEGYGNLTENFYGRESAEYGKEHFGIGLGVCRLLCEKHGGFLQIRNIDSDEISGACVTAALDVLE